MLYENPIIRGFKPDPSICFDGKNYYLICSSFEYFPCLPIFKSKDLINWDLDHYVIDEENSLDFSGIKNSMGLFAPTIRYHKGTYFVVCTNISQGNFICHTTDLSQGWSEPIWIDCPMGIDPSLTFTEDTCYYQLSVFSKEGSNSIIQFEINPLTGEVLSSPAEISQGCGGRDTEAPHIFKKDSWFYLVLAEGGTREGHMVTIQRSKAIYGPYEACPRNPVLSNRDVKSAIQSVGHGDFFNDENGDWWIVALGTRPSKYHTLLGRETILLPVEWENGWPVVNQTGQATTTVESNRAILNKLIPKPANYFIKEKLQSVRYPINYELGTNLSLENLPNELGTNGQVSFLSASQEEYRLAFSTKIDIKTIEVGEFGLAVYKDDEHFFQFGMKRTENDFHLFSKKNVFDITLVDSKTVNCNDETILYFELLGNEKEYSYVIKNESKECLFEGSIAIKHFTNEVANSPFTGIQIGLFSRAETGKAIFIEPLINYLYEENLV